MTTTLGYASTSRFVQAKNYKIHYNEAGTGHPVILLHGGGPGATGWSNYQNNIHELSKKYRVILPDLPGWGKSDEFNESRRVAETQAEIIRDMMDALDIERAALGGNSMGGAVTYAFAGMFNDRMSHLLTMGAGLMAGLPLTSMPGGPSAGIKTLIRAYRDPSPENFRALCEVMLFDTTHVTDALLKQRSETALANPQHLKNFLSRVDSGKMMPDHAEAAEASRKLMAIKTPALIMHGRDDRVSPYEGSLRAVTVIPNSQLMLFNRCGHWVQVEHAGMFNHMVDAFLSFDHSAPRNSGTAFGG
jgi:2-hydroxy-6-oxonona-2,4-dienedioate hydrolase